MYYKKTKHSFRHFRTKMNEIRKIQNPKGIFLKNKKTKYSFRHLRKKVNEISKIQNRKYIFQKYRFSN